MSSVVTCRSSGHERRKGVRRLVLVSLLAVSLLIASRASAQDPTSPSDGPFPFVPVPSGPQTASPSFGVADAVFDGTEVVVTDLFGVRLVGYGRVLDGRLTLSWTDEVEERLLIVLISPLGQFSTFEAAMVDGSIVVFVVAVGDAVSPAEVPLADWFLERGVLVEIVVVDDAPDRDEDDVDDEDEDVEDDRDGAPDDGDDDGKDEGDGDDDGGGDEEDDEEGDEGDEDREDAGDEEEDVDDEEESDTHDEDGESDADADDASDDERDDETDDDAPSDDEDDSDGDDDDVRD